MWDILRFKTMLIVISTILVFLEELVTTRYRVTWRMINILDNDCKDCDENDNDDQMKESDIV